MLEDVLRRDRAIITAGLAGIVVLAWLYLLHVARGMAAEMAEIERHAAMGMVMPRMHGWSAVDVALLFGMWTVMMVAMMVPSTTVTRATAITHHSRVRMAASRGSTRVGPRR